MGQEIQKLSDKELLGLWSTKPKEVYAILLKRYTKATYYQCRRIVSLHEDADDAVQNTWVKVWQGLDNFKGESEFSTWLFRIAYNESVSLLNKRKKTDGAIAIENLEHGHTGEISLDSKEIEAKFAAALEQLPDKQRMVFHYRYYDELSYAQISEILKTSEGGLKANYHHAVQKLKEFLLH